MTSFQNDNLKYCVFVTISVITILSLVKNVDCFGFPFRIVNPVNTIQDSHKMMENTNAVCQKIQIKLISMMYCHSHLYNTILICFLYSFHYHLTSHFSQFKN
ncbi:hypothetical protein T492DRAFT_911920 [Pavlovales sp. CCMP2436]|nr:hypothetical protein T492DRAFT_911920 [Pavlovales sp. CCMP2436]